MVSSLITHERIITTHPKAKAAQRCAERLITLTKAPSLPHWRQANAFLRSPAITNKMFDVLGPRYELRPGGYSRVVHLRERRGDNAPMSVLELVDREGEIRGARIIDEQYAKARAEWMRDEQQRVQQLNVVPGLADIRKMGQ